MGTDKFVLGEIYATSGVNARCHESVDFGIFVMIALERHKNGDWGHICEEDAAINEEALQHGGRLMSVYKRMNHPDDTIWIITEADRSATTVLFPNEY